MELVEAFLAAKRAGEEADAAREVDRAKAASLTVATDFCSIHMCFATRLNRNCVALSCFVFHELATEINVSNAPGSCRLVLFCKGSGQLPLFSKF